MINRSKNHKIVDFRFFVQFYFYFFHHLHRCQNCQKNYFRYDVDELNAQASVVSSNHDFIYNACKVMIFCDFCFNFLLISKCRSQKYILEYGISIQYCWKCRKCPWLIELFEKFKVMCHVKFLKR